MPQRVPMNAYLLAVVALIVANVYVYQSVYAAPALQIRVFTAGKGTAVLVETPRHKTLLIDTGSDASILRALGTVLPMWQRAIDGVVLTTTDSKSTGGLKEMQSRYETPAPVRFGADMPYGSSLVFDRETHITVIAPHIFNISYGAATFAFSSSTPAGTYRTDGSSTK